MSAWDIITASAGGLWPALLVLLGAGLAVRVRGLWRWWRARAIGADRLDALSGAQFERFLSRFFRRAGWQVREVGGTGDYGCDLIITYGGYQTAVQAKRSSTPVGVAAVQEVAAARQHYGCTYALVVTTNTFTAGAQTLASSCSVELWDRDDLLAELDRYGV